LGKLAALTELAALDAKDISKMCPILLLSPIGGELEYAIKDE
jgi:hypothetical protein